MPVNVLVLDDEGLRDSTTGQPVHIAVIEGSLEHRSLLVLRTIDKLRDVGVALVEFAEPPAKPPLPALKVKHLWDVAGQRADDARSRVPKFLQHSPFRRSRRCR